LPAGRPRLSKLLLATSATCQSSAGGNCHSFIPQFRDKGEVVMRKLMISTLAASVLAAMVASSANAAAVLAPDDDEELVPSGKGWGQRATPGHANNKARPGINGITYHGGPLILGTTNTYFIWYGEWSGNTATSILSDLAGNIGRSDYFNISTTYYNGNNGHV